ncbi:MAG: tetratricopeptide repeat protein [Deltaproteobacteria bacterium]|nr:tetratricopeptide repeat protein [Deltaproteobacteria bacterium]
MLGLPAAIRTLSVEPAATAVEAARLGAVAALLFASAALARSGRAARTLLRAIVALGVLEVAAGVVNAVLGVPNALPLHPARVIEAPGVLRTTLFNPNHAASLLALAATVAASLGLSARGAFAGLGWGASAAACAAGVVATGSRGGVLALGAGIAAVVVHAALRPARREGEERRSPLALAGGGATALAVAVWIAASGDAGSVPWAGKSLAWETALRTAAENPALGVGPGALPVVSTAVGPAGASADVVFEYAENLPIQALADWGFALGGAALIAAIAIAGRAAWRARRREEGFAAAAGLGVVVLHDLADFSLQVTDVAFPAVLLAGVVAGCARPRGEGDEPGADRGTGGRSTDGRGTDGRAAGGRLRAGRLRAGRIASWAAAAVALAVVVAGVAGGSPSRLEDREESSRVVAGVRDGSVPAGAAASSLAALASAHPHDAFLLLQAATVVEATGDRRASEPMLRQALSLSPHSFDARRLMARHLARDGRPAEAVAELDGLLAERPDRKTELFRELLSWQVRPGVLLDGMAPARLEDYTAFLSPRALWRELVGIQRAAASLRPDEYEPALRLGTTLLRAGEVAEADRVASRLVANHPRRGGGWLIAGRALKVQGRLLEALAMLDEAAALEPGGGEADVEALACLVQLGRLAEFDRRSAELEPLLRGRDRVASEHHLIRAGRARLQGKPTQALAELERAERLAPGDLHVHLAKAKVLIELDRPEMAALEFRKVLRIDPSNAEAAKGLAEAGGR